MSPGPLTRTKHDSRNISHARQSLSVTVGYDKLLNQDLGVPALHGGFEIVEDNGRFLIGPVVEDVFEVVRPRTVDGLLLCEEVMARGFYTHSIHVSRRAHLIKNRR